ncbi:hypothetical protein G7Y29_02555 [Corynebacterium qintianiae]|uniref:Uncharacterized protein n=1 Tax=Corynebacterium qintianiae TaxID=2709392 RepID=A0A7T0KPM1_9CORY|nr:hypothetical protein [Corynebacterium qintianiae]QPK83703.1 hypothetical protein G7Y29_02555 [Corynebacterium qintianiae]
MYYPVPGHQYMHVLVPRDRPSARPQNRAEPTATVSPLVRGALDAAFGARDAASLKSKLYALGVRNHVNARRRSQAVRGPVRIVTCHAREGGELFGTVDVGGRRFGYVARINNARLVSFKVL